MYLVYDTAVRVDYIDRDVDASLMAHRTGGSEQLT